MTAFKFKETFYGFTTVRTKIHLIYGKCHPSAVKISTIYTVTMSHISCRKNVFKFEKLIDAI